MTIKKNGKKVFSKSLKIPQKKTKNTKKKNKQRNQSKKRPDKQTDRHECRHEKVLLSAPNRLRHNRGMQRARHALAAHRQEYTKAGTAASTLRAVAATRVKAAVQ